MPESKERRTARKRLHPAEKKSDKKNRLSRVFTPSKGEPDGSEGTLLIASLLTLGASHGTSCASLLQPSSARAESGSEQRDFRLFAISDSTRDRNILRHECSQSRDIPAGHQVRSRFNAGQESRWNSATRQQELQMGCASVSSHRFLSPHLASRVREDVS